MGYSNFSFLKEIQPEMWRHISKAECSCYTDFEQCGHESRAAIEEFANHVINRKETYKQFKIFCIKRNLDCKKTRLFQKIEFLNKLEPISELELINKAPFGLVFDSLPPHTRDFSRELGGFFFTFRNTYGIINI